jgi:hypothetical protein
MSQKTLPNKMNIIDNLMTCQLNNPQPPVNHLVDASNSIEITCTICLNNNIQSDTKLFCGHTYHYNCLHYSKYFRCLICNKQMGLCYTLNDNMWNVNSDISGSYLINKNNDSSGKRMNVQQNNDSSDDIKRMNVQQNNINKIQRMYQNKNKNVNERMEKHINDMITLNQLQMDRNKTQTELRQQLKNKQNETQQQINNKIELLQKNTDLMAKINLQSH